MLSAQPRLEAQGARDVALAAEQQSLFADVMARVASVTAHFVSPRLLAHADAPSLWCAVRAGGELQGVYAAAGPAALPCARRLWIHTSASESAHLEVLRAGSAALVACGDLSTSQRVAFLLPIHGFDGRPALLVEWEGTPPASPDAAATASEFDALTARLRAAVGHSGAPELLTTYEGGLEPCMMRYGGALRRPARAARGGAAPSRCLPAAA